MRLLVGLDQPVGVDGGIDLGRGKAGVAEELLDRPEVAAARQEVGRERVPEGMRRRGVGEAERAPEARYRTLYDARVERAAASAHEKGPVGGPGVGTLPEVIGDGLRD